MIVFCQSCKIAYLVVGDLEEKESLLKGMDNFPCVTPLCRGRMVRSHKSYPEARDVVEVPLHGFYRAIHGFGSPKGDPAPVELSKRVLLTKKIVDVHAEEIGQPKRTILKRLILEDGTRLHFSRSTQGACLYYVEVPNGQDTDDDSSSSEVCPENREEAGRDIEVAEVGQAWGPAAGAEVPRASVPPVQPTEGVLPDPGD